TPRPEMFAVPGTMSLEAFTAEINSHSFSRVPVYGESLDSVTRVAFALYIPETKKVNELLREMQREKQHMSIVIDEYGGVAGLVTIEDLLEAIVGNIEDEHDTEPEEEPVKDLDGSYVVPGSFEVSRLRGLFEDQRPPVRRVSPSEAAEAEDGSEFGEEDATPEQGLPQLLTGYD